MISLSVSKCRAGFESFNAAKKAFNDLLEIAEKNGFLLKSEFYSYFGVATDRTFSNIGWSYDTVRNIWMEKTDSPIEPWVFEFPDPVNIDSVKVDECSKENIINITATISSCDTDHAAMVTQTILSILEKYPDRIINISIY